MNKATHVEILGVQIPLRGLAFVTSTPPSPLRAGIDQMMAEDYRDIVSTLKTPDVFTRIAERKGTVIPISAGVNRRFFTYDTFTKSTPDLKPWE